MLVKTEVIVLGTTKYGDNSIILRTYSKDHGLLAFIAGGIHSKKGPLRPSMVQVLSVLQVVFYDKARGELKRLKEAAVEQPIREIFYDPVKSSLAMFLAEILQHVINEEEENPRLFQFLRNAIFLLDEAKEGLGSFHLKFLYRLTAYLGFQPETPGPENWYFDLLNGIYCESVPMHAHSLQGRPLEIWRRLHDEAGDLSARNTFSKEERRILLDHLILYYRLHVKDFGKLKSQEILSELLS